MIFKEALVVRADAGGIRMGTGHIMRCIALAQAWCEEGGAVTFVISNDSIPLRDKITTSGFFVEILNETPGSVEDALFTAAVAGRKHAGWIVIDGYQFNDQYQNCLVKKKFKLLVIDDQGHADDYPADIVLNQNIYASMDLYPNCRTGTRFLLGTRYLLLRHEILEQRKKVKQIREHVGTVLVTMGGSDPDNVTGKVIAELCSFFKDTVIDVKIITGKMNPSSDLLARQCLCHPGFSLDEDPAGFPGLIMEADIVITGAGTTSWEVAFLGTPMITVSLSDNQKHVAHALQHVRAAVTIGDKENVPKKLKKALADLIESRQRRSKLSQNAMGLIDGQGADRVVATMRGFKVRLRPVTWSDCSQLLAWANDPYVRLNAFDQAPIDAATHAKWFSEKMKSPYCCQFIALDMHDRPVGQIRFDIEDMTAMVDISVDNAVRQQGLGVEILKQGLSRILASTPIYDVSAYVKKDNIPSKKTFERAGFVIKGEKNIRVNDVFHLIFIRPDAGKD